MSQRTAGERSHLSIGEVLSLLQDEFPDVTISKIRFLESQGLLDPERTPSGYRKFYEGDVRRLRWILTEQRDSFLPLKVIRERLADGERPEREAEDRSGNGAAAAVPRPVEGEADEQTSSSADAGDPTLDLSLEAEADHAASSISPDRGRDEAGAESDLTRDLAGPPAVPTASPGEASRPPDPAPLPIWMADAARAKVDRGRSRSTSLGDGPDPLDQGPSTVSLTLEEMLAASGLNAAQLTSLEEYGLVPGHQVGADRCYDGDDLVIAQKAAGFLAHGVEARHLRLFKTTAEREAALYEQLVLPLVRGRQAESRSEAQATVAELAKLGQGLRAALLRAALGPHLS